MLKVIVGIVILVLLTIGIVWVIDKYVPKKAKPAVQLGLWALIFYLAYATFMSVYGEIQFNQLKVKRYKAVIENLKDIRDAELAHLEITGRFTKKFDHLIQFIDTAQYTITQRRDSSILDKQQTKIFGVDMFKDIVLIDTLGYVPVKDSLFGSDERFRTMMNIPEGAGEPGSTISLAVGELDGISVFEAKIDKKVILFDQDANIVSKEREVISLENVSGPVLKVGSLEEVNTNGNWPKTFADE